MYTYICIYLCTYIYIYMNIYIIMHIYMYMYACIYMYEKRFWWHASSRFSRVSLYMVNATSSWLFRISTDHLCQVMAKTLQHTVATHCNTLLQHTATYSCNTLQHTWTDVGYWCVISHMPGRGRIRFICNVCCSVLQAVAGCCNSMLQCVAMWYFRELENTILVTYKLIYTY